MPLLMLTLLPIKHATNTEQSTENNQKPAALDSTAPKAMWQYESEIV